MIDAIASPAPPAPLSAQAAAIVRHYTILCAEAMFIPFWWASSPSITGLQLKMLADVSRLYGVELSQDVTKPLVASLAGGGLSVLMTQHPISLALKRSILAIPIVGVPLRFGTGPAVMAGYTWLLGQAFIKHHESGGTYLTFHAGQVRREVLDTVSGGIQRLRIA